LWWDGDRLCLFAKRLERDRFVWPRAEAVAAETATEAQKPARRALPQHLPREDLLASGTVHLPQLRWRAAQDRRLGQ
jgi:transposase